MSRVVIVGGGISGLSTAYYLSRKGIGSTIVESSPRLGGVIQTREVEGCTVEYGPDSFLSSKGAATELVQEIGLGTELIGSNDHKRVTYIWRQGRLRRLPEGFTMMVPAKVAPVLQSDLLSWRSKIRAGFEIFRRPAGANRDRSIAEFVGDHYGEEVLNYIAEPLLAGVYGGDPALMSTAAVMPKFVEWESRYGSLTRAARKEIRPTAGSLFTTVKGGLQTIVDRLAQLAKPLVIQGSVDRVEKGWRVHVNGAWAECEHLVVACRPSTVLPNLFPEIPYRSATVVAVGYRKSDIHAPFRGFGFLVPRVERKQLAACTWVGNKFDYRVPDDKILLRCFMTSATADPLPEIREKLGITAEPLFLETAHWPHSMPQYHVGHKEAVSVIEGMLTDLPGLHLVGNAYGGIGIPDCIRMGKEVAERIARATG